MSDILKQRQVLKKRITDVYRFSGHLLPYWDKQMVLFICMGFSVLFGLAQPYFARVVIDHALLGADLYLFNMLLVVGVVSYLFSIPIECIQKAAGFYLSTRVSLSLRSSFYRKMQALSLRFSQSRPVGEQMYRLGPDLESVGQLIVSTLPGAIILFCRLVLLLVVCFWISYKLTIALLLVTPIIYAHTKYFTRIQKRLSSLVIERTQGISSRLQQALAQLMLIKIFGKEKKEYGRFISDSIGLIRLNIKNLRLNILRGETSRLLSASITGGMTYFLGYQVIKAQLTLGQLTAISMYLFQLNNALLSVGGMYNDFVIKFIALDRVVDTLDEPVEVVESPKPLKTWTAEGSFEFKEVTFGYRRESPILKSINLKVERGERLLLRGSVGSGKSTLCYLLLRLYDPLEGQVLLNEADLKSLKLSSLRSAVGYVGSEPMLLQDSVYNNICFGSPEADYESVAAAAETAGMHELIESLPYGYDTIIETGGDRLSQGQKQGICLARVLHKQPEILVLDEAFSSMDGELTDRVSSQIKRRFPEMTTLLITHHAVDHQWYDRAVRLKGGILSDSPRAAHES